MHSRPSHLKAASRQLVLRWLACETRSEYWFRRQLFVTQSRRMAVLQAHNNTSPLSVNPKGIMVEIFSEVAFSNFPIKMTCKSSLLWHRTGRRGGGGDMQGQDSNPQKCKYVTCVYLRSTRTILFHSDLGFWEIIQFSAAYEKINCKDVPLLRNSFKSWSYVSQMKENL